MHWVQDAMGKWPKRQLQIVYVKDGVVSQPIANGTFWRQSRGPTPYRQLRRADGVEVTKPS